jgi:RNA polymerase sigma factor (sigma-70 family)
MRTEDGDIIQECLNGKPEAFGILVDKYKAGIYAFVYSELANFHDAQDVTQEAFLQAYRGLRKLRVWESFSFWLYCIARNLCKKWINNKAKRPDKDFIDDQDPKILDTPSLNSHHENQIFQSLQETLDTLPEDYRQVLTLHYFGGMKIKDMASALSVPPTTIAKRLSRARMMLKEEMIAMMGTVFEEQKLRSIFTFRIVEIAKRIRIQPTTIKSVPWGLSVAIGLIAVIMSINPALISFENIGAHIFSPMPVETKVLKVGEIPVDVVKTSNISFISSNEGKGKGGELKPDMENAFFMAPQGEGGEWTRKADMPTARVDLRTGVVDGIIYAIGGSRNGSALSTVEAYDPKTDKWTKKKGMPTARVGLSTCEVDGIIYAIGGWPAGALLTVESYDPKADKWTKKADMPTKRDWLSTSVVDGIIYAIGGWDGSSVISAVEAYDPKTDKWTKRTDMPIPRFNFSTGVVNGIIYAIGGQNDKEGLSTVEAYDPGADKWTKKRDISETRYELSASVVNGKIYAIGGSVGSLWNWQVSASIEEYDPVKDIWTRKIDMPTARTLPSTSVVKGKIYAIGGGTAWNVALNEGVVEEYTPEGWSFSISPQMKLPTKWGTIKAK